MTSLVADTSVDNNSATNLNFMEHLWYSVRGVCPAPECPRRSM